MRRLRGDAGVLAIPAWRAEEDDRPSKRENQGRSRPARVKDREAGGADRHVRVGQALPR